MEDLREVVLKVNQIDLQCEVLKTLQEKKMTSSELRDLVERLGGDHELILPSLKATNLLKFEKIESSHQFWYWIPNNNGGHKPEPSFKIVLPTDQSVYVPRKEIRTRKKRV
jgi:hypothetical protein